MKAKYTARLQRLQEHCAMKVAAGPYTRKEPIDYEGLSAVLLPLLTEEALVPLIAACKCFGGRNWEHIDFEARESTHGTTEGT